jgi:hypothetical protein
MYLVCVKVLLLLYRLELGRYIGIVCRVRVLLLYAVPCVWAIGKESDAVLRSWRLVPFSCIHRSRISRISRIHLRRPPIAPEPILWNQKHCSVSYWPANPQTPMSQIAVWSHLPAHLLLLICPSCAPTPAPTPRPSHQSHHTLFSCLLI